MTLGLRHKTCDILRHNLQHNLATTCACFLQDEGVMANVLGRATWFSRVLRSQVLRHCLAVGFIHLLVAPFPTQTLPISFALWSLPTCRLTIFRKRERNELVFYSSLAAMSMDKDFQTQQSRQWAHDAEDQLRALASQVQTHQASQLFDFLRDPSTGWSLPLWDQVGRG